MRKNDKESDLQIVERAQRCLTRIMKTKRELFGAGFFLDDNVAHAEVLRDRFRKAHELRHFRAIIDASQTKLIDNACRVFEAMRVRQLTTFNAFLLSGFDPNENRWSDVLARLLDPRDTHDFGKSLLLALLDAVRAEAKRNKLSHNVDIMVAAVKETSSSHIKVERNVYHLKGLPDIVISGSGDKRFTILIENKRRDGSETFINREWQTERYNKIIEEEHKTNPDEVSTLLIFLSPTGSSAHSPSFVPLSTHELAQAMLGAFDSSDRQSECRHLTRAFLMTYDWLN
jgi:hypothetical protein